MRWTIHIGAPKTGSTAIQRFLFDNRQALAERGVLYPDVSLRGYGHHDLAFLVGGGYPEWATPQPRALPELVKDLQAVVAQGGFDHIILSSENFFIYPDPSLLKSILRSTGWTEGDETNVVVYVRRQDDAQASWYNQAVKAQGYAGSLEQSLADYDDLWDYLHRLRPWAEAFGESAMVVRDYAPFAGAGLDIRRDFLAAVGVAEDGLDFPQGRANERINRDILEFQRLINRLPISTVRKRQFHKPLIALTAHAAGKGVFDDRPLLSPEQAAALVRDHDARNRRVAERYLAQDHLFEPWTAATGRNDGRRARPGLSLFKIGYILTWLLAGRRS